MENANRSTHTKDKIATAEQYEAEAARCVNPESAAAFLKAATALRKEKEIEGLAVDFDVMAHVGSDCLLIAVPQTRVFSLP
jgi:hypothetical protein